MSMDPLIEQVPPYLRQQMEPSADRPGLGRLQLYAVLLVAIDGRLQMEQQAVDVRHGTDRIRVYVRWAVPGSGFEWDGREATGKEFGIVVLGPGGDRVVNRRMRCVWFAAGHDIKHATVARAIFECDAQPPDAA